MKAKKFLLAIAAVAMCFSTMALTVFAAGEVAQVGDVKYSDITVAVANAKGKTLKLLQSVDMSIYPEDTYVDFSDIVVDLNGKTITTGYLRPKCTGNNFTIKNGTIEGQGTDYALWIGRIASPSSNVVIADVTTVGGINIYNTDGVTLTNVTATGRDYYAVWCDANVENVVIESGSYTGGADKDAVLEYRAGSVAVVGGEFSTDVSAYAEKALIEQDGKYFIPVAEVNGVKYATLQAAVNAAADGATVTLLSDVTGSGVVIKNDVTVDFAGYTYTVNRAVGSAGTETLAFQILAGSGAVPYDVTLKNGTIAVVNEVVTGKDIKVVIMNYSNLTLDNMILDGTGSDAMMYGLATNNGASAITGATSILVNEGVTGIDVDGSQKKYGEAALTVNTTGVIEGKVDVYGDEAEAVVETGTFDADVTAYVADGKASAEDANGKYIIVDSAQKDGVNWQTLTDAGFYVVNDEKFGMMRFAFKADIDPATVTEVGIKYIKAADITEDVASAQKRANIATNNFYGDVVEIPQGTTGNYYAAAYITTADGTVWSDTISCTPNWNQYFEEYTPGN